MTSTSSKLATVKKLREEAEALTKAAAGGTIAATMLGGIIVFFVFVAAWPRGFVVALAWAIAVGIAVGGVFIAGLATGGCAEDATNKRSLAKRLLEEFE